MACRLRPASPIGRLRTILWACFTLVALAGLATSGLAQQRERPALEWYGYIKLDASWDSSLITPGNFARWVESPDVFDSHGHFNMTARQTRLGFRVAPETEEALQVTGHVEVDFYGGGAENKNALQVRHAYLRATWPASGWSILAGQSSDVVAPLNPPQLNYTVAWWAGNIGYRRPQLRVGKRIVAGGGTLLLEAAVSRTIGDDFAPPEPGDTGADSELPTFQGRGGYSHTVLEDGGLDLGVSGHWGRENLHRETLSQAQEFDSWSVALDLRLRLGDIATVQGELWTGQNLDDQFGGIGQGIDFRLGRAVDGRGGWSAISVTATDRVVVSTGIGVDDPDDDDASAGRLRNRAYWSTVFWDFAPGLRAGFEVSHWQTRFLGIATGESYRVQGGLIYTF